MAIPTKEILAAIEREHPASSRSPLSRWMRRHHDDLVARIGERPDWSVLAQVFAESGLTDRSGKPASPETARKAWQRVRKEIAARKPALPSAPRPLVAQPDPTPAEVVTTDPSNPYGFRFSKPRTRS